MKKKSRNLEAIPAGELDTYLKLRHDSSQTKWRQAIRFVFDVKKQSALFAVRDEQKSQRNILKDNGLKQCR